MERIISQLTEHNQILYKMLLKQVYYKYEIEPTYKQFIITHYEDIIELINEYSKWSQNTKQAIFFMLSKVYKLLEKPEIAKETSQEGYNLKQLIEEDKKENKMNDNEKYSYLPHEQLIDIFNKTEFGKTRQTHYNKLLLGLLILQPPLRSDMYISCKIINNIYLNNGNDNYLLINDKNCHYIVNQDKVSKHPNKTKIIHISNIKLINLLKQSIKLYPRERLFETPKGGKLTEEQLLKLLRKASGQPQITVSIMRSNFVMWYYKHNSSLKSREKLAEQMRHTSKTGHLNYHKEEPIETKDELKEFKFKMDTLFEQKQNKLKYNKMRRDILYSLIKNNSTPKDSTILKYNLELVQGVWC